jgi:hypothetical protein
MPGAVSAAARICRRGCSHAGLMGSSLARVESEALDDPTLGPTSAARFGKH